ncbi:hypothetical protein [Haloarchaeobius baliensis]|uniref:hypothetical protein n=1 Tax=Haloarchaeobius baliensis TaxID=1670458 RepID=UPI003F88379C
MATRQMTAVFLILLGVLSVGSVIVNPPGVGQGGPGVAYAAFIVAVMAGGGLLAIVVGLYSSYTGRYRLSTVVSSGYVAVGLVYGVYRLRLFLELPATVFAAVATGFVIAVMYGTFRLTPLDEIRAG